MHWEEFYVNLAISQEGIVGRHQVRHLDAHHVHWHSARRSRRWEALSRRVLRLVGAPLTAEQRAFSAVFDAGPGGFLSSDSALSWYGVRPFRLLPTQVARRRSRTTRQSLDADGHRYRALADDDIIVVRAMPVIRPIRAVWELAAAYSRPAAFELGVARVGRVLDDLHRQGLVGWRDLHHSIDRLGGRGRRGTTIMRALGEERPAGSSATESRSEAKLEELLRSAGRRPLVRQTHVGGTEPIGRADFRDPDLPLVVEVNSLTFHTAPTDVAQDAARYEALLAAGFTVAVVWEDDLWSTPREAVATIDRARRSAAAGRRVVHHSASATWTPIASRPDSAA